MKSAAYALKNPRRRVSFLISRRISSGGSGGPEHLFTAQSLSSCVPPTADKIRRLRIGKPACAGFLFD
ncbi:MAG: hypothetical protein WAU96_08400, partial [Anaerolineae bacterium]